MADEIVSGVFISELKNRFLCHVMIDQRVVECYIPSSCKLSNFLSLEGKEVLLKRTQGRKTRTEFAVYAVRFKHSYLLLNLAQANYAIEKGIRRSIFKSLGSRKQVSREITVGGYKTDLYIHDTQTVVEIKSLLTAEERGQFPTVYSERANIQLRKILNLLSEGYKVCYMIVSLNPYVKEIELNGEETEFHRLFLECVHAGMICMGVSLKLSKGNPIVNAMLDVKIS